MEENTAKWEICPAACLGDESNLTGFASGAGFAENAEACAAFLRAARRAKTPVTVQGARTGLYGGAVPMGGYVLDLSRMNRLTAFSFDAARGEGLLRAEAGATLAQIQHLLRGKLPAPETFDAESARAWERYRHQSAVLQFVPDPTEDGASVGGMIACNAGGPCSRMSGIAAYLESVEALTPGGAPVSLSRAALARDPAAFCGAEGTEGIVTAAVLRLAVVAGETNCVWIPFAEAPRMFAFLDAFRKALAASDGALKRALSGAECLAPCALALAAGESEPARADDPVDAHRLLLFLRAPDEDTMFSALMLLAEALSAAGVPEEDARVEAGESRLAAVRDVLHRVTEAGQLRAKAGRACFADLKTDACDSLYAKLWADVRALGMDASLTAAPLTGECGVRLLPKTEAENAAAEKQFAAWRAEWKAAGVSCARSYGVGRVKAPLFAYLSPEEAARAAARRAAADPDALLNRGVCTMERAGKGEDA